MRPAWLTFASTAEVGFLLRWAARSPVRSVREEQNVVHVRFEGDSYDFTERQLELWNEMTDAEIKARVARHLEVPVTRLASYVVDRGPDGDLTVRPPDP